MTTAADPTAGHPDPFDKQIAKAQQAIDDSIARAGLTRDAYGHALKAMRLVIGTFPDLVQHLEATRQPVQAEEMRQAVVEGISTHAGNLVRALNVRNWLLASAALVVVLLTGGGAGYWLRGPADFVIGTRAGPERCDDRQDGSRLCWIPIWERMPPEQTKAPVSGKH